MVEPRVPGGTDEQLELPCGETVHTHDLDLGMRELSCACGDTHAVVMDVHPLGRFVPEFLVDTLRATITTDDDYDEFSTAHAVAMVREEYPEEVVVADCSSDGDVGFGLVWIADMDSRQFHRAVVELLVELMEHAISHAEDGPSVEEFEEQLAAFELDAFVDAYRAERDFDENAAL